MKPFKDMMEARTFFHELNIKQNTISGDRSCLVRFMGGVRRVTLCAGMCFYGDFTNNYSKG
jgi:hypothetical protein